MAEIKMEQIAKMYGEEHTAYWNGNKMEQVAKLFGKNLGEEFTIKYQISKYKWCIEYHLAFTNKGLTHYGKSKDVILRQLLTGQAVIIDE